MAKRERQRSPQTRRKSRRPTAPRPSGVAEPAADSTRSSSLGGKRPASDAVALFEKAMQRLQRHDYRAAATDFERLVQSYPAEGALKERSLVYLALCERERARRPAEPRTVEERVTAATAALNNGDDASAEAFVSAVLREAPQHDLALYLLAAIEARRGAADEALLLLSRALSVNPEIRAQARHDADFETIRELDAFRHLIDSPAGPTLDELRRARRARGDR